jgi:hypothetical protein
VTTVQEGMNETEVSIAKLLAMPMDCSRSNPVSAAPVA